MKKKILIAIDDNFTREAYSNFFQREGFNVMETGDGKRALELARTEMPDIILVDVLLPRVRAFDLIRILKEEALTEKIPIMVFSQEGEESDRTRAMDLHAKDFIVGAFNSISNVALKARAHLGEQRTYRLPILRSDIETQKLAEDLGYHGDFVCEKCSTPLVLFLIRDMSKGKDYFKASFMCPHCD
jgi:DNA-binding response OmpR family regulator